MTTAAPTLARKMRIPVIVAGIVLAWFAVAELATYAWYSAHESKLPRNPVPATGEEVLKRAREFADANGRESNEREIGDTAMEMLKCSFGKTLLWSSYGGGMSAVTVLKWDERSVVGGVDAMHNPGTCLRAAGWAVGARTSLGVQNYCGVTAEVTRWEVSQQNTQMQAYSVVFRRYVETKSDEGGPKLWSNTRLKSVISGRRDAPVMILLAYLPVDIDAAASDAKFHQIMKALFCAPGK
jgi:hypothetical protein